MKRVLGNTFEEVTSGPWFTMRKIVCDQASVFEHLGPAQWALPRVGSPSDCLHWVFEASCGLQIGYTISSERRFLGTISASLPENTHLLRHDPWLEANSRELDKEEFEAQQRELISCHGQANPILKDYRSFQVWRMGDDGNAMPVEFPTSEIDARCHVAELESHKHKQIYWYRRCQESPSNSSA